MFAIITVEVTSMDFVHDAGWPGLSLHFSVLLRKIGLKFNPCNKEVIIFLR